ncbi:hypothetical protein H6P81_009973 [Aristolochia fimbriata]|uniref:Uncharacterized protein n=1 Tax=Aristolochia fimbriata TaxID=158543 RepID=A0AAV7EMD9_ARIFI|nr:hypothetical protein H6P81_009973 [Aristolochia fimbriata]
MEDFSLWKVWEGIRAEEKQKVFPRSYALHEENPFMKVSLNAFESSRLFQSRGDFALVGEGSPLPVPWGFRPSRRGFSRLCNLSPLPVPWGFCPNRRGFSHGDPGAKSIQAKQLANGASAGLQLCSGEVIWVVVSMANRPGAKSIRGKQLSWDQTLAKWERLSGSRCQWRTGRTHERRAFEQNSLSTEHPRGSSWLVGRMRSTEHPREWQLVNDTVSAIYRLCFGDAFPFPQQRFRSRWQKSKREKATKKSEKIRKELTGWRMAG